MQQASIQNIKQNINIVTIKPLIKNGLAKLFSSNAYFFFFFF